MFRSKRADAAKAKQKWENRLRRGNGQSEISEYFDFDSFTFLCFPFVVSQSVNITNHMASTVVSFFFFGALSCETVNAM